MKKYLIASFAAVVLLGSSQIARADIASNLLIYYPMEDNAASTAVIDASNSGHNGVLGANTQSVSTAGKIGSAFSLTSATPLDSRYIWSANDANFTLSFWFKTSSVSQSFISTYNGQQGTIAALLEAAGRPECQAVSSNGTFDYTIYNHVYSDGAWHHMACVLNGTTMTMYMDNAAVTTKTNANWNGNYAGRAPRTMLINPNASTIDDLRVYNRALSSSDVTELYNYTGQVQGGGNNGGSVSPATSQLSGWAWSSNVGWFSFNSNDPGTGNGGSGTSPVSYEVDVSTSTGNGTATFSGYAWSPNVGWLSFQPSDASVCGSPATGAVDPNGNFTGQVTGYARVVSEINRTDIDGWDGCVKLGDSTPNNPLLSPTTDDDAHSFTGTDGNKYLGGGVTYSTVAQFFKGFAWSSNVLGWLAFSNPFPSSSVKPVNVVTTINHDFRVTGNQVQLSAAGGSVDTTAVVSFSSDSDHAEQDINLAISSLPSGVTATIKENPATCVLTASNQSCTFNIHVASNSATPGFYTATLTGTRTVPSPGTQYGSLVIDLQGANELPVNLFIGSSVSDIDSYAQNQKPTSLSIKKGNPFSLEWSIDLDPAAYYPCTAQINKGNWPEWNGEDAGVIFGDNTGSQVTGHVDIPVADTSDPSNIPSIYLFTVNCLNKHPEDKVQNGTASLILKSSSESEF